MIITSIATFEMRKGREAEALRLIAAVKRQAEREQPEDSDPSLGRKPGSGVGWGAARKVLPLVETGGRVSSPAAPPLPAPA